MKHRHTLLAAAVLAAVATLALAAGDSGQMHGQGHHERAETAFADTDSNHDGKLSRAEWQAARLRESNERFARLDANRDGNLTQPELDAAREQRRDERREHRGERMREKLQGLDSDGDEQLSRAEIGDKLPRLAENFDRLDANADGKLSREEMRAGRPPREGADARR